MTKSLLIALLVLMVSCVPESPPPEPPPPLRATITEVPKPAKHQEGADTQCSYFYYLWGKTSEDKGRFEEALDAYEKAIVCDAEADYVLRHLTVLLLRMDRKQQALEWLDKLLAANPDDQQVKAFQADIYGSIGDDAKAIVLYEALLTQQPDDPELLLKSGRQYLKAKEYLKARDCLEHLVSLDPESFMGQYYLAQLYRELKYTQKAIEAYQRVLALNWTPPLAVEVAEYYESQKKMEEAIALYQELLSEEGMSEEVVNRLVRIYLIQRQPTKALSLLEDLRHNGGDGQKIDLTVGRILLDQHRYHEAIKVFTTMLAQDPRLDLARSLLAMAWYGAGDHAQARTLLLKVKKETPGYEDALSLLVKMYVEEKEFRTAITLIKQAIADATEDEPKYYFILSSLYEEQGKESEAEKVLLDTVQRHPTSEMVYFNYGMFLERRGRLEEAMTQMKKVLELKPDDPLALNYIGYSWADRGENLSQALVYIQKAVAQRPDDGFVMDSLGWVYFRMRQFPQAVEALEQAVTLEPQDPTIHEHLGDVYVASAQTQLALDNYQQALALTDKAEDKTRLKNKIGLIQP